MLDLQVKRNIAFYCGCLAVTIATVIYGNAIINDYSFVRVWNYTNVLILLIGVPFLFLQKQARLPDLLEPGITDKQRLWIPAIVGIGFGLLDVLVIKAMLHPEPYTELPPFLQPFPYSIFLYFSGAFEVEVFYRLIPLTIILCIGNWFKGGRYFRQFFWTAIILTSLREPLDQMPSGSIGLITYSLVTGFAMNFLQAWFYTKAGFIASLALRLGHYLVWHILLGIYVQFVELG